VLDDPQHATPLPPNMLMPMAERMEEEEETDTTSSSSSSSSGSSATRFGLLSRKSLRQAICVLLALLRVHHVVSCAVEAPPASQMEEREVEFALRQHHIEASMDTFNDLQQMVYLAPGQRLAYRTAFCGMYNHVSQVVYFHHPRFCRSAQLDLARIPGSPMHMVPLVMQLLPEITLVYDDDAHIPSLTSKAGSASSQGWRWLVCCGAFFLLDVERGLLLSHERMAVLVAHYLRHTGKSIGASDLGGTTTTTTTDSRVVAVVPRGGGCTPFNHVRLL
jgi:hypothetical protein